MVAVLWLLLLGVWPLSTQASGAQYVYDAAGRLVQVIAPDGTSAQYTYDLAGNLLAVTPLSASTAAVTGFSNVSGASGSTITIYGSGFSPTAANDHVSFGGIAATVVSATANSITVTVPNGATTGSITVTSPNGTVTSNANFILAPAPLAPAITSLTPQQGTPGTAVTINGNNFSTVIAKDQLQFAGTPGTVSAATAGVLSTSVPVGASSGKISVTTPYGTAVTTNDFFVPPSGYTVSSIAATGRLTVDGGPLTITVGTAGKIGLAVFDGLIGQRVSVQVSGQTFQSPCGDGTIQLNSPGPDNTNLSSLSLCSSATTFLLPATGTYTLVVIPSASDTGGVTLKVANAPTITVPISIGGAAVTVTTTVPAQMAQLTFTSTAANQIVSLQVSGNTYPSCGTLPVIGPNPETTQVAVTDFCTVAIAVTLPTIGTYTLVVQPSSFATGSLTIKLVNAPTITAPISIGGAAVTVATTVPAQIAQLSFTSSAANQIVSLQVSGNTYPSCGTLQVIGPNPATTIVALTDFCTAATAVTLPTVGTYTLSVLPSGSDTGSLTIKLVNAPTVTGSISIGGAAVAVSTTVPAQIAQLSFTSTTANQTVSLQVSGNTYANCAAATLAVIGPNADTTTQGSTDFCTGTTAVTLAAIGTYTLSVVPFGSDTGSLTIQLQ